MHMKKILALAFLLVAATPAPRAGVNAMVPPNVPKVPLHTEFIVELNSKGQVVKAVHGTFSKDGYFNAHTYGNVLQMWIRTADNTAIVGLYKVWYDYDPKTKKISRDQSLVKAGGDWGNQPGAATTMVNDANAEEAAYQKFLKDQARNLPPLDQIIGSPSPHPHT